MMHERKKKSQEQCWQEAASKVASITDALGMPIDEGIREMVIALNVLGIQTLASCEGHGDHGVASPWVDIGARDARPFAQKAFLKQQAVEQAREQGVSLEQRRPLMDEAEQATLAVKRLHVPERLQLVRYLDAFYKLRPITYESHLVIIPYAMGISRLESQGADYQDTLPEAIRAQKLRAYQEEMQAFAAFLKKAFLAQ
jgi:hypothetical protein